MSSRTEKGLADDTRQSLVEQKVRVTYDSSFALDHVDDFSILDASKYKFYQMIEIRHQLLVKLLSRTRAYEVKSVKAEGENSFDADFLFGCRPSSQSSISSTSWLD